MAMSKAYYTVEGQIWGEHRNGEADSRDFMHDNLGNVVAVFQNGWEIAEAFYKPHGEFAGQWNFGAHNYRFAWVGAWGYRKTNMAYVTHYIRARHYSQIGANWTTVDPLWPQDAAYGYVKSQVLKFIDYWGTKPVKIDTSKPPVFWPYPDDPPKPKPKGQKLPPNKPPTRIGGGLTKPPKISPTIIGAGGAALEAGIVCGLDAFAQGLYTEPTSWNNEIRKQYYDWCMGCCNNLFTGVGAGIGGVVGAPGGITILVGIGVGAGVGWLIGKASCSKICESLLPPVIDDCGDPFIPRRQRPRKEPNFGGSLRNV